MSKSRKITLGTKEWADSNVNCYLGCSNECRYCYARKIAIRFNKKTYKTWKIMEANQKNINKSYSKRKGRVMFPTSHDITDESIDNCLIVLEKLLIAENDVLVTTKPKLDCIKKICNKFKNYKDSIQFRFTITSINNELLIFWEPGAPLYEERFNSLKLAYKNEFKTSVSIEPFLDKDPYVLVNEILPYVSESIWIGKMNYIKANNFSFNEKKYYNLIRKINSKENILKIIKKSNDYNENILRIKDSMFNYIKF